MNRVLSIIQTHKGREMEINHEEIDKFEDPIVSGPIEDSGERLLLGVHFFHGEVLKLYCIIIMLFPPGRRLLYDLTFYLIMMGIARILLKQFLKHLSLFKEILEIFIDCILGVDSSSNVKCCKAILFCLNHVRHFFHIVLL